MVYCTYKGGNSYLYYNLRQKCLGHPPLFCLLKITILSIPLPHIVLESRGGGGKGKTRRGNILVYLLIGIDFEIASFMQVAQRFLSKIVEISWISEILFFSPNLRILRDISMSLLCFFLWKSQTFFALRSQMLTRVSAS